MLVQAIRTRDLDAKPGFPALVYGYIAESAHPKLPSPVINMGLYHELEDQGVLHAFEAVRDGELVGFMFLVVSIVPHYGVLIGRSESLYVLPAQRGWAGRKLLNAARTKAHAEGAAGFYVSARAGSTLAELLPLLGFEKSDEVFMKALS